MNNVTQPMALRLKEAGWEWDIEKIYTYDEPDHNPGWFLEVAEEYMPNSHYGWLPAPNIAELRERLTFDDMKLYWGSQETELPEATLDNFKASGLWHAFSVFLYKVHAAADELAKVWLWVNAKGKGESK